MNDIFTVQKDHESVLYLLNTNDHIGRLIRWWIRLTEFDFEVNYKKNKSNTQVDGLSRLNTMSETTTCNYSD